VPKPRVNLTRFHGVFAPNSKNRALVTKAARGKGAKPGVSDKEQEKNAGATPGCHKMGATSETGIRHQHRNMSGRN